MQLVDDRILEYIQENETGSPTEMKDEGPIYYSRQYIARRCKKLAEKGLLRHLGNAVYSLTEEGEMYLDGKLNTQTWTEVSEENEPTASETEQHSSSGP